MFCVTDRGSGEGGKRKISVLREATSFWLYLIMSFFFISNIDFRALKDT